MKCRWLAGAVCALAMGVGCQDEDLQELVPAIAFCADGESTKTCGETVDLGEVALTAETERAVFIRDVGDGKLSVKKASIDDDKLALGKPPSEVSAGAAEALPVTITLGGEEDLGPHEAKLVVESNDPKHKSATVTLTYTGVPGPSVQLCPNGDDEACGTDVTLDFGTVRRGQVHERLLEVRNVGELELEILEVRVTGASTTAGELVVSSSTEPASLPAGEAGPIAFRYEPQDGDPDELEVVIVTNDPVTPEAHAIVKGASADNAPPIAVAKFAPDASSPLDVVVDDVIGFDGRDSSDPEGDPLVYRWTLDAPDGSSAAIDPADGATALFVPDVAGSYAAHLVVLDSLGQESDAVTLAMNATPHFGFRAHLTFGEGGDADLHLVKSGSALFSADDCRFDNRVVDGGDGAVSSDDAELVDDSEVAPGDETIGIREPLAGTWSVFVHVFDDAGGLDTPASVTLSIDDGAPALALERTLGAVCTAWHVADVTLPAGTITSVNTTSSVCP